MLKAHNKKKGKFWNGVTVVGVTGSFCTGKTMVSALFKNLGAHVIDADKIVHLLYNEDKKIRRAILKNFGRAVFTTSGKIDRRKLAKITFSNRASLNKLQGIIHPGVIKKIKERARRRPKGVLRSVATNVRPEGNKSIIVVDAPLLIEAGLHKAVDYIVVVRASLAKQIERGVRRGFKKQDCLARRRLQMPLREKIKYADFVIDNNRSREYTKKQVIRIWKGLKRR